jgi:glutamine---fructose-6-phosphate transaminase (isomerizing)
MCGIFGVIAHSSKQLTHAFLKSTLFRLATLSESRGKESSGFASLIPSFGEIKVLRGAVPVSKTLKTDQFRKFMECKPAAGNSSDTYSNLFALMGHSRLVTNGSMLNDVNNQPVIKDGIVGIHNGIIVNDELIWTKNPSLRRDYEIDTEALIALVRQGINNGMDTRAAVSNAVGEVFGTVSLALMFSDRDEFIITTNNGSLYYLIDPGRIFVFASESYILKHVAEKGIIREGSSEIEIAQVRPGTGVHLNLSTLVGSVFGYEEELPESASHGGLLDQPLRVVCESVNARSAQKETLIDMASIHAHPRAAAERKMLEFNWDKIGRLKRCTRCLMPETFPFIVYDEKGVCNLCNNYQLKNQPKPIDELLQLVEPYRSKNGDADCIVPFSGGRDSTYTLHIVKKILKLNPIAFTYDWGMVTDLARRNIARVCGRMGVENIIVSADIRMKRANIRKNILAWLRCPDMGMIPLFMAGDKYFFYYTEQIKRQTGIKLNIWGINALENTDFKVGFCGIPMDVDKKRIYSLTLKNMARLFGHVMKNVLANPAYINSSVIDTFGSFVVRNITPHKDYYHMFDYYRWDEREIEELIVNTYEWEIALDTKTTWRIGDGTAGFYNYLYFNIAGFSEHDTFRSNQIREGMMTRENGMKRIELDNQPRYESIKWYLEIVGLDYEDTIRRVNAIPKLYD